MFLANIVLISFCVICNTTIAGQLPSNYPSAFMWSGSIQEISTTKIIIEDREFSLSSGISINLLNSHSASINNLRVGMIVGCQITQDNQLQGIWQFPESLSSVSGPWAAGMLPR
jgi:hypothetical protein